MLGAELAGRTGMPSGRASLSELQAALGAYTGLDAASPRTAEIVGAVVAAITATVLAERPRPAAPPRSCMTGHGRRHPASGTVAPMSPA